MGRIDSALQRAAAGAAPRATPQGPDSPENPFTAPWDFSVAPVPEVPSAPAVAGAASPVSPDAPSPLDAAFAGKLVGTRGISPVSVEQYRRLAATLHQGQADRGTKVVMIASAAPSEGKTLTTLNVALTLSASYGRRVLLIDADLRRPALHTPFRLPNDRGLADSLRDGSVPALYEVRPRLSLMPAGRPTVDPMSLLTAPRMRALVKAAATRFDWVLLDTAPVAALADADLLSDVVDGVLLVVAADRTGYRLAERAAKELGRDRILGVVLNGVEEAQLSSAYTDARYYEPA